MYLTEQQVQKHLERSELVWVHALFRLSSLFSSRRRPSATFVQVTGSDQASALKKRCCISAHYFQMSQVSHGPLMPVHYSIQTHGLRRTYASFILGFVFLLSLY